MELQTDNMTNRELLTAIHVWLVKLDRCMTNHLTDHKRTEDWHRRMIVAAFGAALAALGAGVFSLIAWAVAH